MCGYVHGCTLFFLVQVCLYGGNCRVYEWFLRSLNVCNYVAMFMLFYFVLLLITCEPYANKPNHGGKVNSRGAKAPSCLLKLTLCTMYVL